MTKRDILSIVIKVLGVICVICAVASLPDLVAMMLNRSMVSSGGYDPFMRWSLIQLCVSPFLFVIMAVVLLRWGDRIARRMVPEDDAAGALDKGGRGRFAFGLALRVVGVVTLVRGIPQLLGSVSAMAAEKLHYGMLGSTTLVRSSGLLVGSAVLVGIGVLLAAGAGSLAVLLLPDKRSARLGGAS
jgi:hypothetical protein